MCVWDTLRTVPPEGESLPAGSKIPPQLLFQHMGHRAQAGLPHGCRPSYITRAVLGWLLAMLLQFSLWGVHCARTVLPHHTGFLKPS